MVETTAFPEIIEIELTTVCNLSCRMCQRQTGYQSIPIRNLKDEIIRKIVEEAKEFSPQINLGGLGEGFMVPELPDLLRLIKDIAPSIDTGINTNGILLNSESWKWLCDGRLDYYTVSICAPNEQEYKWLIGSDYYKQIETNTKNFLLHKGKGKKPLTSVHLFDIPRWNSLKSQFEDQWSGLADFVQIRSMSNWGGKVDLSKFGVIANQEGICPRPWKSLAIDADGNFHRCCASFLEKQGMFNIFSTSIKDYWAGKEQNELRNRMVNKSLMPQEVCFSCNAKSLVPNTLIEHDAYEHHGPFKTSNRE